MRIKAGEKRLHTTQSQHRVNPLRMRPCYWHQQLAVKAAENSVAAIAFAETLPLDWVRVDLQGVALQGEG